MSDQSDIDDDIVKRLREYRTWSHWPPMPLTTAAADEIERLRAEIADLTKANVLLHGIVSNREEEISGIRAQLEEAKANAEHGWTAAGAAADTIYDLRAQLASAESQLRLAFFPFRLQARPAEGGDWTDIYPAQLQAFTKGPYDVRAIELPLTDEEGNSDD